MADRAAPTMADGELEQLRSSIAEVLETECDRRRVHAFAAGQNQLEDELWGQAAKLGWFGLSVDEDHGGLGQGLAGAAVLCEQLGAALAPGAYVPTLAAAEALSRSGSAETRAKWLPRLAAGEVRVAVPGEFGGAGGLAFEGGTVSGAADLFFARSGRPDLVLAPVSVGGAPRLALVEIGAGCELAEHPTWDPTRGFVRLNCRASPAELLEGSEACEHLRAALAVLIAADSLGGMAAVVAQTVEYMKTRVQFGKPIGSFQALKHRAANHETEIVVCRHLQRQALESWNGPDADTWAWLAKARLADSYAKAAGDCVQLHGGVGFTAEFDIHLFLKRARLNEMLLGRTRDLLAEGFDRVVEALREGRSPAELAQ